MKKFLFIILCLIIAFAGFYFWPKKIMAPDNSTINKKVQLLSGPAVLQKGDFSLNLPSGWKERDVLPGNAATISPNDDSEKNYFSVIYESVNGNDLLNFVAKTKNDLKQGLGEYQILEEKEIIVNSLPAHFLHLKANKDNEEVIIYMAILKGKNDGGWILALNATGEDSTDLKNKFEEIIQSFALK